MTTTTTSTDTQSVVREWTDALNRHDPDAALEFIAEQCIFHNYGAGQRQEGRDAVLTDFVELFARWSDVRIDTVRLLVDGDHYAKQWVMTGIHTGDMPGLPATGRPFAIHGAGIGEVRDGKLVNVSEHWNLHEFLNQVKVAE